MDPHAHLADTMADDIDDLPGGAGSLDVLPGLGEVAELIDDPAADRGDGILREVAIQNAEDLTEVVRR